MRAYLTLIERARRITEDDERISASTVRRIYARATEEIKLSLQPLGYYNSVIKGRLEELPGTAPDGSLDFLAHFTIDPGPQTHFRQVIFDVLGPAAELPQIKRILKVQGIASGQPLSHAAYDDLKAQLQKLLYRAGYLDAGFSTAELKVYPSINVADVTLVLDGGEPYFFGPVTIEQDILDPAFVDRYVKIRPGEPFNTERLIDLQLKLAESAYFAGIAIDVLR